MHQDTVCEIYTIVLYMFCTTQQLIISSTECCQSKIDPRILLLAQDVICNYCSEVYQIAWLLALDDTALRTAELRSNLIVYDPLYCI